MNTGRSLPFEGGIEGSASAFGPGGEPVAFHARAGRRQLCLHVDQRFDGADEGMDGRHILDFFIKQDLNAEAVFDVERDHLKIQLVNSQVVQRRKAFNGAGGVADVGPKNGIDRR